MVCTTCSKESANRRVCPYCFTPYPPDAPAARGSVASTRQTGAVAAQSGSRREPGASRSNTTPGIRGFIMRQSPIVRWSGIGIIVVSLVWFVADSRSSTVTSPPGTVPANIITAEMSRDEAISLIKQTREQSVVESQADEVFVSYSAGSFPVQIEGQLALVQQFTRADEIVEARKRRITFYDPNGRVFAQSDGMLGVKLVR